MSEEQIIDLDKLISDKTVKGVADVRLELENKKLGDGEILRLAEMEVLGEVTHLELGENKISDQGLAALCKSPHIQNLKSLNLLINTSQKLKNEKKELYNVEIPIHWGGPVSEEQIYILHSKDYSNESTDNYRDFSITRDYKILFDIAENNGPKKSLVILGYSGWGDGQLEGEMEIDHWILSELDSQIIFEKETINKWLRAYENSFIHL